jgi:hypothetical protein
MLVVSGVIGVFLAGGCVTPWTPTPVGESVQCGELDAKAPKLPEVTKVGDFKPVPNLPPGFLLVKYYGAPTGNDVYAVGIHIADHKVSVAFFVGPLKGVPSDWRENVESKTPTNVDSETLKQWTQFFGILRQFRYVRPGGFLCRNNADCGKSPDAPPPEVTGSASVGGGAGSSLYFPGESPQRYAQLTTPRMTATDATVANGPDNTRIVAATAADLCKAIDLLAH